MRAAAFTACVAFGGGAGWWRCGFGLALVAALCWGGAEVVVATTGRDDVTGVELWDVDELEDVVVTLGGGAGVAACAVGAGSGPSRDGAFTGGRSGPAA